MLQLQFPNLSHKQSYLEMISEWASFEDVKETSPGRLFAGQDFEDLLAIVTQDITNNSQGVNSHLFFLVDRRPGASEESRRVGDDTSSRILGAIQIRHHIDHPNLSEAGGHIGYGIRPSERGKGYATEMLRLGLIEAQKLGLEKVLITCYDDNIASAKVIENNGGVFERYAFRDEKKYRRYWISTTQ